MKLKLFILHSLLFISYLVSVQKSVSDVALQFCHTS